MHSLTEEVKDLWASLDTLKSPTTAADVHRAIEHRHGLGCISRRLVQVLVKEARADSAGTRFTFSNWEPWRTEKEHPEAAAYLLRMNFISEVMDMRRLYKHEAEWAVRISAVVEELDPLVQLFLAREYAIRQQIAVIRGSERPSTYDLDLLLAIQPWKAENADAWSQSTRLSVLYFAHPLQESNFYTNELNQWVFNELGVIKQATQRCLQVKTWRDFVLAVQSEMERAELATALDLALRKQETGYKETK